MGKSTEKSKEKTTEKVKVKKDKSKSKSKSSSKRRKPDTTEEIPSTFSLAAPEKAIDSSLAALFGSSVGPLGNIRTT